MATGVVTGTATNRATGMDLPERDSRAGWTVVAAAMIGLAFGLGPLPFYTIGMLAPELSREFGWSFASLMGSITVQSLVVMASGPVAGFAVDRYGARPVALISLVLFGLTFMSLSLNNGNLWIYYAQWVAMSVLGAGTLTATWTHAVNDWFDKHRGLALGIASTGTGITGFLIKPFAAFLIGSVGWRWSCAIIGLLPIMIGVPVVALWFRERGGDKAQMRAAIAAVGKREEGGLTVGEALRSRRFWIMALAFLVIAFALTAPTPNLENILRTFHFDLARIGGITAGFGLAVIAGRVAGGWLLDRFWAPGCALAILCLPALGSWLLSRPEITPMYATLSVIALGLGAGFEFDLLAYLIARYFGRRSYGTIYGCFFTVIALGGGLGPVVYGYVYDTLGRYDIALAGGVVCLLSGGLVLLLLGPYPKWDTVDASVVD